MYNGASSCTPNPIDAVREMGGENAFNERERIGLALIKNKWRKSHV